MKKITKIFLCLACPTVFCLLLAFSFYEIATAGVRLDKSKLDVSFDRIEIFDGEDELAQRVSACYKNNAFHIEELDEKVKFAFVDAEDKRFYSHNGFDYKRMAKAALTNLKARSFKQGASTISQQLVKNTHLSQEKTIKRKLKEMKLTKQLEKSLSKDQILEKYLNSIYFGHDCFGLNAAANFYFEKNADELTVAEGAILAGLVRSPNNYSPFKHPENCLKRKTTVLNAMLAKGHLTKREYDEAKNAPLPEERTNADGERAYFSRVYDELEELSALYGFPIAGKIKIYSYLRQDEQSELCRIAENAKYEKTFVVADRQKKGITAYYSDVGTPKRLPGSLLKPLLVYAPALEEGLVSPATPLLDEETDFGGYSPKNYDGTFRGYVSVRKALAESLNVPAVRLLSALGTEKGCEYLKKLGLQTDTDDKTLALALGGMKRGYTLLELTQAYLTLSDGGVYSPARFIRKIETNGTTVYERNDKSNRVFSEETAYLATDILKTAATQGTAKKLRSLPFDVAAKTGTNGTRDGNTDAYTVSYTTSQTVGVWLGHTDGKRSNITGGGAAASISLEINNYLGTKKTPAPFSKPEGIEKIALDKASYYACHNAILADEYAPEQYKFYEIFNRKYLPKTKSECFSNPFVSTPEAVLKNGTFHLYGKNLPEYYAYHIDRYDYVTHTTVYDGKAFSEFADSPKNGTYVYTLTPYYKNKKGKPIVFPEIKISGETNESPDITEKDWWSF